MRINRRVSLLMCLVISLAALPANADGVWVDYDHDFDFSAVETFAYGPADPGLLSQDKYLDKWIVEGIVGRLEDSGLRQVDADPDIVVTYQVMGNSAARLDVTTVGPYGGAWGTGWGFGAAFGAGWGWAGGNWGATSAMITDYRAGTLIIDAFDTSTKMGVWRGVSEQTFHEDYDKASKAIEKSLKKISQKWRHLHKAK